MKLTSFVLLFVGLCACSHAPQDQVFQADVLLASDATQADDTPWQPDTAVDAGVDQQASGPDLIPTAIWLGINDFPQTLLGDKLPWAVPPTGWSVQVHVAHPPGQVPKTPPILQAQASDGSGVELVQPQGAWNATATGHDWAATIIQPLTGVEFIQLRAIVAQVPSPAQPLHVRELPKNLNPFAKFDHWLLLPERDLGQIVIMAAQDAIQVQTIDKPNGKPDLDEAMLQLGLMGGDENWQKAMKVLVKKRVMWLLRQFFFLDEQTGAQLPNSVKIEVAWLGDLGAPTAETAAKLGWSQMAIGGEAPLINGKRTLFGQAVIDWNNQQVNDDTAEDHGIFTTSLLRAVLTNSAGLALLSDYMPALGGKPFGSLPGDDKLLAETLDPKSLPPGDLQDRATIFQLVLKLWTLALASITAHEMGHSLGLIRPGLPPLGLLAGVDGPWAVSVPLDTHIDLVGPNLMQTGAQLNIAELLSQTPSFEPHSLAYFRGQIVVGKP